MTHPSAGSGDVSPSGSNIRGFLAMIWRRRLVALLVLLLTAGILAVGLWQAERQYTAVASVSATPQQDSGQASADYADLLGTLANVVESRPVLEDVRSAIPDRSLADLQDEVDGSVIFGTVIVQVRVTDPNPVLAARIANAVVAALPSHDPSQGYFAFSSTEPAAVPRGFTSPNLPVTLLAGLLLGIALAVVAATVVDKTTRTIQTAADLAEVSNLGVLGVIPRPDDPSSAPTKGWDGPQFPSLRALRVALEFASTDEPTRTLVVAAAEPDPFGGWLEVNLAGALAEVGHRVLLVDANRDAESRHPVLDAPGHPGLYDMLAGAISFDGACRPGPVEGVTVLPLGNVDLAAPSLLEMRFRRFLEGIDEKYDVILIHAAALTESVDARVMAVDGGILLTVPSARVKPRALERVVADLRAVRIRIVGTVLVGTRNS